MLSRLLTKIRNNEASREEKNEFFKEVKIIIKSHRMMNVSVAQSNAMDYDDLVSEATVFTFIYITRYKCGRKVTTQVYKLVDSYTKNLHKKTHQKKRIPPELIESLEVADTDHNNSQSYRQSVNTRSLLRDKSRSPEDIFTYKYMINDIRNILKSDRKALTVFEKKLKGYLDINIAKILNITPSRVSHIKENQIRKAILTVM